MPQTPLMACRPNMPAWLNRLAANGGNFKLFSQMGSFGRRLLLAR